LPDSGVITKQQPNAGSTLCEPRRYRWKARMTRTILVFLSASAIFAGTALAADDVPAGWSVDIKPKRAILTYAPEANGPRYLIVACLRDTEEIGVYSTGVGVPGKAAAVALGMTNAGRKYSVRGEFGLDGMTGAPAFRYETNIDNRALSIFRSDFPPMLGGKGPLTITIGDKSQALPLAGVAEPLKKFNATCFGKS
jgi:hypothetical protein